MAKIDTNWIGYTVAGRYKIEAILGRGGMSTVYRADDPNLQRKVALKLIHPHLSNDPEFIARFEREAAAMAQLRHPNIVQVYDFNHEENLYYMVLEYVPGETLQARLKTYNATNQRFLLSQTIELMARICETVAYAHGQGMIHRDLKPANVMLNAKGQPVLMDFGVAKLLGDAHQTLTGTIIGTAKYMSPEQARGEHPDERADIYSLGVMLYEIVAGQCPFEADSDVDMLMKHATQPVPDIRLLNQNTPDSLVAVVERALAKKPKDRYQSASDMANALRAVELPSFQTVPSPARAPSRMELTVVESPIQWRNKRVWLVGAIAALALVLILGLGVVLLALRFFNQPSISTDEEQAAEPSPSSPAKEEPLAVAEETEILPTSAGMVKIAAGSFTLGQDLAGPNYVSPQQVMLTEFWLDQVEVTNAKFAEFLEDTGGQPPAGWPNGEMPPGQEQYPVKGVSWQSAATFCSWAKKRLPTEAEWEAAARGPQSWLYPWGDDQHAVELPRSGTYAVGTITANRSSAGVFDMAGNVWEWVGETYDPVPGGDRVLHGGENGFLKDMAYRLVGSPDNETFIQSAGFRCAADQVQMVEAVANVLYEDDFTDPTSGWINEDKEGAPYRAGYHPPDYYHVEVRVPNDSIVIAPQGNFDNVTVETDLFVDFTDTDEGDFRYGLALRHMADDQFYAFTISPRSGAWFVLKQTPGELEVLDQGSISTLTGLTAGQSDRLRVDANGAIFAFYIDEAMVSQVTDADYAGGSVGFYVETFDESLAHVHYDSLTIREVEEMTAPLTTILYEDKFADPSSGWITEDVEGEPFRVGYHPPDYYHVEVRAAEQHEAVFEDQSFEDATVETDLFVDFTDTDEGDFRYGLALRHIADDQFYAFTISPRTGTWYVLKETPDGPTILAEGTVDTLKGLTSGVTDHLRVDAQGDHFVFHINGEPVTQVTDADYAGGPVGFYVETFDESLAHVHYDSLTIREVEEMIAPLTTILYEDKFADPSSGWITEDVEGEPFRVGYHPPDYYHVEVRAAEQHEAVFEDQSFEDATVETDLFVDFTDTNEGDFRYGLALRHMADDQFYAFTISPRTGTWFVLKETPDGPDILAEGTVDTLKGLTSGVTDHLRVDAQGDHFVFHINGEPVTQVADADYAGGSVGFYVETFDESLAHVHYDSLTIREVDTSAFELIEPATPPPPDVPEGMVLIPAGYFTMGSSSGQSYEQPAHPVFLDAFYLDLYEVTNAQYRECVLDRGCTQAGSANSATYTGYRDDPAYDDYPVASVTWDQADAYCKWAGKHLPSEAQWEYAARGPDNFMWPWGDTFQADLTPAGETDTQPVGSYADGVSPFGVFDMAGNVAEWILDDYDEAFYENSPTSNPVSKDVSAGRVFRGGSYNNSNGTLYTTSRRDGNIRTYSNINVGFRCALDAPELTSPEERGERLAEFCEVYAEYKPEALCP